MGEDLWRGRSCFRKGVNVLAKIRYLYLWLTVILCGGVVMALEILGTRVIGTFYGSSLYIWGALITVTLVSLAVGYYCLGILSDKYPRPAVLYLLVLLAGCAVFLVFIGKKILAPVYSVCGAEWGAVVSAFIIFTPSITLLGGVGPFTIRLIAAEKAKLGKSAGSIYALSTVGSVIGTLFVSFYLIPRIGTTQSVAGLAVLLIALAAGGLLLEGKKGGAAALLIAVAPFFLTSLLDGAETDRGNFKLLYRGESLYSRFVVVDDTKSGERFVLVNGIQQTGMPLNEHMIEANVQLQTNRYYFELLRYYNTGGAKALLVGLAGGMLPKVLANHEIETTAVDIDDMAIYVAKNFFGFEGKAEIKDGRRFIEDCREKYDYCILDAYASDVIPFHLVTEEMFHAVKAVLKDDGVLAINYIGYPKGAVAGAIYRTVSETFGGNVHVYKTEDTDDVQTVVIFASPKPLQLTPLWPSALESRGVDPLAIDLERYKIDWKGVPGMILTDNYNPVDLLRVDESLIWRRKAFDTFGAAVLW